MASSIVMSFLLLCSLFSSTSWALSSSPSSTSTPTTLHSPDNLSSIKSVCMSTPYPDVCLDSLKLSISINIDPSSLISFLLHSLQTALSEAGKLSDLFSNINTNNNHIVEKQRGTIQDCKELHQITLSSIKKSVSKLSRTTTTSAAGLADARAFLSAALTNKNTCLEGLDSASGPYKQVLVNSVTSTYKHVSNSLSILSKSKSGGHVVPKSGGGHNRRLLGLPKWLSWKDHRILQDDYDPTEVVFTVAADGTGNFTTISDAIKFAPNNSLDRTFIYISQGVYQENVDIPSYKPNIVLLGDGSDVTVITGSRSVGDNWTTFRSATVAVSGEGFLARDITFENRAGPKKYQAVALRINADLAAIYRCTISGYQDTLYTHSFRQFYRECDISGTIDYIFGNAAVVFQGCDIVSKMPMPGQFTVITAQSRDTPDEETGIAIQNCSILATEDLYSNSSSVKSYLGRPWQVYSRTVYIESYIDDFINPEGWREWFGDEGLDTLYYGEYENSGPGSGTDNRVTWPGYYVMDYDVASTFAVSDFIAGQEWLEYTSFPYYDGV